MMCSMQRDPGPGPTPCYVLVSAGDREVRMEVPPSTDPRYFLEQIPELFTSAYGASPRNGNPWRKATLVISGAPAETLFFIVDR